MLLQILQYAGSGKIPFLATVTILLILSITIANIVNIDIQIGRKRDDVDQLLIQKIEEGKTNE